MVTNLNRHGSTPLWRTTRLQLHRVLRHPPWPQARISPSTWAPRGNLMTLLGPLSNCTISPTLCEHCFSDDFLFCYPSGFSSNVSVYEYDAICDPFCSALYTVTRCSTRAYLNSFSSHYLCGCSTFVVTKTTTQQVYCSNVLLVDGWLLCTAMNLLFCGEMMHSVNHSNEKEQYNQSKKG